MAKTSVLASWAICLLLAGCATVSTERVTSAYEQGDLDDPFPPYDGPRIPVQVIRFGISEEIVAKYPELADKRIGWGLSNRIIEGFYDTHRFEYVEQKAAILSRIQDQWNLAEAGVYFEEAPQTNPGLKQPKYLIYAEVYEFSVTYSEILVGIAAKIQNTTIMGIQLRMVDVATGQFIPASGQGEATTTGVSVWVSADIDFDQSTVGIASQRALTVAIRNLLNRMDGG